MDDIEERKKLKQQQQKSSEDGEEVVKQDDSTTKTLQQQTDNLNNNATEDKKEENGTKSSDSPPAKRQKKSKGGQNKARPRTVPKVPDQFRICPNLHRGNECRYGDKCRFAHDVQQYMKTKPADVGEHCVNYQLYGKCKYGVECRFAKNHLAPETFENMVDEERHQAYLKEVELSGDSEKSQNVLTRELMNRLRKRQFKYHKTGKYLKKMALKDSKPSENKKNTTTSSVSNTSTVPDAPTEHSPGGGEVKENPSTETNTPPPTTKTTNGTVTSHNKEAETTTTTTSTSTTSVETSPTPTTPSSTVTIDITPPTPPASQQPEDVPDMNSDIKVQQTGQVVVISTPLPTVGCVTDEDQIKLRACEKKKV